jgi:4-hydroxy-tetrahydrodipicolinate synthase
MSKGVLVPCITILHEDGSIDYENMVCHAENLIRAGVDGILLFGSTGEFYAISLAEKKKLVKKFTQAAAKRTQIIVGINSCDLHEAIDFGQYCKSVDVDAVMVISPYYFPPSDISVEEFFGNIAKNIDMPIFFYNFPTKTGNSLNPDTLIKLIRKYPNFIGIKDTVDMISHTRLLIQKIKAVKPSFLVYSGFDEYYCSTRLAGGDGIVGAISNFDPQLMVRMHKAYEADDFVTVKKCSQKIVVLMELYTVTPLFISAIKVAVKAKGLNISCYTKAPATQVSEAEYLKVLAILQRAENV